MKITREKGFKTHMVLLIAVYTSIYFMAPKLGNLGTVVVLFVASILIFTSFLRIRNRKVNDLVRYLKRLNRGDYQYDLEAYDEGELSILHSELNKTTITLKTANESLLRQKHFMNQSLEDIVHQLKTPITALSILNDLQNQQDEYVKNERVQIQRLESLTQSILKLVKLDAKTMNFKIEPVNLELLCEKAMQSLKPLIEYHQLTIHSDSLNDIVLCDSDLSLEAIQNVLNNKLRFAKSTIFIRKQRVGSYTDLYISDDGDAILPSQRDKIFKRFYSGVNRAPESIGIGLSFSKEIMVQQDGNLRVIDDNTFVFRFQNVTLV